MSAGGTADATEVSGSSRDVVFAEIAFGSEDYARERRLRDEVLRRPLGLSLEAEDPAIEKDQLHRAVLEPARDLVACVLAVPFSATEARIRQMAVLRASGQGLGRGSSVKSKEISGREGSGICGSARGPRRWVLREAWLPRGRRGVPERDRAARSDGEGALSRGAVMPPSTLRIKVKPNARSSSLEQLPDGSWTASLKSPPVDGRANEELISLVANRFRCRKDAVTIKAGRSGRMKLVLVESA